MYEAPTLKELSAEIRAAFKAQVPGADAWVWPNSLYIIGKVFAGVMRAFYKRLEVLHLQARVPTASAEYLDLHGSDDGLARNAATYAAGTCSFTTDLVNTVPAGARLLRSDRVVFVTDFEVVPTASPATVVVRAAEPGVLGNTDDGAVLTLETPISGVGDFTVDTNGLTGGVDRETDVSYRARILDRRRNPPHGGSPSEYIAWAREVAGVTRVFVHRATPAAGSVTVYVMMDESIYADGVPSAAAIATVQAHLNVQAPANANVIAASPTPVPVNITISALSPNTARVRDAVKAELRRMFRRRAKVGEDFPLSWLSEAISIAAGENTHTITVPAADVSIAAGEIAVPGAVSFP